MDTKVFEQFAGAEHALFVGAELAVEAVAVAQDEEGRTTCDGSTGAVIVKIGGRGTVEAVEVVFAVAEAGHDGVSGPKNASLCSPPGASRAHAQHALVQQG